MANFCLENQKLFVKLPEKIEIFWKFAWENQISFVKLPEKIEIWGNLPGKIKFFLPRPTTPQISNRWCFLPC